MNMRIMSAIALAVLCCSFGVAHAQFAGVTPEEVTQYRALVATLPPSQQTWEQKLESNLGNSYFPNYLRSRLKNERTVWEYVTDKPSLPRVIIVGDSVSLGYTLRVRDAMASTANIHRAPTNTGPTTTGLAKMDYWLNGEDWDVILFNFAIHDAWASTTRYHDNLSEIVRRLKVTNSTSTLVWARTTPFDIADLTTELTAPQMNQVSDAIMLSNNIATIDLYTPIVGHELEYQLADKTHYNEYGKAVLAAEVVSGLNIAIVPEPSSLMAAAGLGAFVLLKRFRQ